MKKTLPTFWLTKTPLSIALWPLSLVYQQAQQIDALVKKFRAYKAPVPVVSIGNITVGGAGKTPLVAWLAGYYAARGEMVAILSRGYGGRTTRPHLVNPFDDAAEVGDEPKMLAAMFARASVQVWVCPDRTAAAKRAVQSGATMLILDDGFQHYRLHRDVDVVVLDGTFGTGNGFTLPAGPLREPLSALGRTDMLLAFNTHQLWRFERPVARARLSVHPEDIKSLKDKKLLAFAGTGLPEKFFTGLKRAGLNVAATCPFPDHHIYTADDIAWLKKQAAAINATPVTTMKDVVRLPHNFAAECHTVRTQLSGSGLEDLVNLISRKLGQQPSTPLLLPQPDAA